MIVIVEGDRASDQLSIFFDKNLFGPIDHHFADVRIVQQRLDRTIAGQLIQNLVEDLFADIFGQVDPRLSVDFLQPLLHELRTVGRRDILPFHRTTHILDEITLEFEEISRSKAGKVGGERGSH
jgi:hypothetical protein